MSKYDLGDVQHVGNIRVEGDLTSAAGRVHAVRSLTASGPVTVTTADEYVLINGNGAVRVVNVPTPVGNTGRLFTIKKTDAGAFALTVTPAAGLIDGAATFSIAATQYKFVAIISDGTNYQVVDSN
jgi:hypothetical protein